MRLLHCFLFADLGLSGRVVEVRETSPNFENFDADKSGRSGSPVRSAGGAVLGGVNKE